VGDDTKIALFSLRFGVHVVHVRDCNNKAQVFSSHYDADRVHKSITFGKRSKVPENNVWKLPNGLSDVIWLWQHIPTGCFARHKGSSVDEKWKHYSLLEPFLEDHDISPLSLVLTDLFSDTLGDDNETKSGLATEKEHEKERLLEQEPKPSVKETEKERPWDEELEAIEKEAEQDPLFERYSPVEPKDKEEDGNPNDVNEQVTLEQSDQERFAKEEAAKAKRSEQERIAREEAAKEKRLEQERIAREEAAKAKRLEQEQFDNERMGSEKNFVVPRKRKPSEPMKGNFEEDEHNTQYQPLSKKNKNENCKIPKTLCMSNKVFHNNESGPLFRDSPCSSNRTIFEVTEVMGDGNCLYQSLSQSWSIFLWAVNPKDPCRPVHGSDKIKHFVTLNYTEQADVLLSKDVLTFEKIKYNQDNCHPIVEK
jgi:hypothetical protein